MKKKIFSILILSAIISGCYYDIEEELYGGAGPCDTSNTTYSGTIVPILQGGGCMGCHSGASASGNIRLDSYTNLKIQADNGRLYGAVNHSAGYAPMPQGGNKLLACDINKIKAWIDSGSPNN